MTEWWTYRPADLLMFSTRTHERMFEHVNAEWWPLHGALLALGLAVAGLLTTRRRAAVGAACAATGAAWAWVAWFFVRRELAAVHTQGELFAWAFAAQAMLLLGLGAAQVWRGPAQLPRAPAAGFGALLIGWALAGQPLFAWLVGRPWLQAQVFGLAPDPTAMFTLGLLLMRAPPARRIRGAWLPWLVPLAWCGFSAMTSWTLGAPEAWPVAVAMVWALAGAAWTRRLRPS